MKLHTSAFHSTLNCTTRPHLMPCQIQVSDAALLIVCASACACACAHTHPTHTHTHTCEHTLAHANTHTHKELIVCVSQTVCVCLFECTCVYLCVCFVVVCVFVWMHVCVFVCVFCCCCGGGGMHVFQHFSSCFVCLVYRKVLHCCRWAAPLSHHSGWSPVCRLLAPLLPRGLHLHPDTCQAR